VIALIRKTFPDLVIQINETGYGVTEVIASNQMPH